MKFNSVLLIDDDEINNFIIKRMFKKMNLSEDIIILNSGVKGLQYINELVTFGKTIPSVLLVDMHMPVMTGMEFLMELKKIPIDFSDLIIIPISNGVHPEDLLKLQEIGLNGYVIKPISYEKLESFINCTKVS